MADWRAYENAQPALKALEEAAEGNFRWTALAYVLRVIICLLLQARGHRGIPVADLDEPDDD